MLGVIIAVVLVVAAGLGLELGSPHTLQAVIRASVLMIHAATTHVDLKTCTELTRLGDVPTSCPSP
jgi:hypothetical protein